MDELLAQLQTGTSVASRQNVQVDTELRSCEVTSLPQLPQPPQLPHLSQVLRGDG